MVRALLFRDAMHRYAFLSLVLSIGCSSTPPSAAPDGGASAPDAATTCDPGTPNGHVLIAFSAPNVTPVDCVRTTAAGPGTEVTLRAAVTAVASTGAHLDLDFCSPAADCVPMPGSLQIDAAGLSFGGTLPIQVGQFVSIHWREATPYALGGCTREVEVWNEPTWDGMPNTVRAESALLVAASNGVARALPDSMLTVDRAHIGCVGAGPGCGDGPQETFAISFGDQIVRQGQHTLLQVGTSQCDATTYEASITGACDDSGDFEWTVRESPPTD